jgi:hypothetical protein
MTSLAMIYTDNISIDRCSPAGVYEITAPLTIHAANLKFKDYRCIEVTGNAGRCKVDENIDISLPTDCFITTNAI